MKMREWENEIEGEELRFIVNVFWALKYFESSYGKLSMVNR
jgi:hypothetical protein